MHDLKPKQAETAREKHKKCEQENIILNWK